MRGNGCVFALHTLVKVSQTQPTIGAEQHIVFITQHYHKINRCPPGPTDLQNSETCDLNSMDWVSYVTDLASRDYPPPRNQETYAICSHCAFQSAQVPSVSEGGAGLVVGGGAMSVFMGGGAAGVCLRLGTKSSSLLFFSLSAKY